MGLTSTNLFVKTLNSSKKMKKRSLPHNNSQKKNYKPKAAKASAMVNKLSSAINSLHNIKVNDWVDFIAFSWQEI